MKWQSEQDATTRTENWYDKVMKPLAYGYIGAAALVAMYQLDPSLQQFIADLGPLFRPLRQLLTEISTGLRTVDDRVSFTVATLGIAGSILVIRARDGVGQYHVNQYRIYFVASTGATAAKISEQIENRFEQIFEPNGIAEAHKSDERNAVLFMVKGWKRWVYKFVFGPPRFDGVRLLRQTDRVFQADTALINETPGLATCLFPKHFAKHFLSGTRSWYVGEIETHEFEPISDQSSVFFLETAAFERYSSWLYWFAVWRSEITKTWRDFVCDAMSIQDPEVLPADCKLLGKAVFGGKQWRQVVYRDNRTVWEREVAFDRKKVWYRWRSRPLEKAESDEPYFKRLFQLHPGLKSQMDDSISEIGGTAKQPNSNTTQNQPA